MKRYIKFLVVIIFLLSIVHAIYPRQEQELDVRIPEIKLNISKDLRFDSIYKDITYLYNNTNNYNDVQKLIDNCESINYDMCRIQCHLSSIGYPEDGIFMINAEKRKHEVQALIRKYKQRLIDIKWEVKASKYNTATIVWRYLKETCGYSDYVCAGIMGNLMIETGGCTLALDPYCVYEGHYGLLQWKIKYNPEIQGANLSAQLDYLKNTIQKEFKSFGSIYYSGFGYNQFINMTDIDDIALAFAKVYERCGSGSYTKRQRCAHIAYNFFVN